MSYSDWDMATTVREENGRTLVDFVCWSCGGTTTSDLETIQEDRIAIKYMEVKPNPRHPARYFLRCSHCDRFNSVEI